MLQNCRELLLSLRQQRDLSAAEAETLFAALVAGELADGEIADMLMWLKTKGETTHELIGAAQALRAADLPFHRPDYMFADCCGTGGDGSSSINVSTAVAFVAAAAGLPIVKHGNRSFSSRCGSADVLEALGARIAVAPGRARNILDETKVCFLFAPIYHPALKHAAPARARLKVRTIMNLLGPCLNPAEPPVQLLGVADPGLLDPIARTLNSLGVERALIVHGSGLDEVALHDRTEAIHLDQGRMERLVLTPEEAGIERMPLEAIRGGGPHENARRLQALVQGKANEAEADLVAINCAALLMVAGLAPNLRDGVEQAREAIRSGAAARTLENFIEATNG